MTNCQDRGKNKKLTYVSFQSIISDKLNNWNIVHVKSIGDGRIIIIYSKLSGKIRKKYMTSVKRLGQSLFYDIITR